jgi:hypothetical protein
VFRNLGVEDGVPRFGAVAAPGPTQYWPSGALLDADHDGRLDVVLADFDAAHPTLVLRNESVAGHWLGVEAPPGTRLEVEDPGVADAPAPVGVQVVDGATGFGGGAPPVAWFGVGAARAVDLRGRAVGGREFRIRGVPTDRLVSVMRCAAPDAVSPVR